MSVQWYSINVIRSSDNNIMFSGYFRVNTNSVVDIFYNANNINDTIIDFSTPTYGADYEFSNGGFSSNGPDQCFPTHFPDH